MARTTAMRLVELMVLREDIHAVLKYLGELGEFQFQQDLTGASASSEEHLNPDGAIFSRLEQVRTALDIPDLTEYKEKLSVPSTEDESEAVKIIDSVEELHKKEVEASEMLRRVTSDYSEAQAFSNLKVSYSELESLSFLTLRIGKIDPAKFDALKEKVGARATIVKLGDDGSRILAASSKKARFALDADLKEFGFVELSVPKDFKGIPEDVLISLKNKKTEATDSTSCGRNSLIPVWPFVSSSRSFMTCLLS